MVGPENIPNVTAATAAFHSNVTDPKAAIITAASAFLQKIHNQTPFHAASHWCIPLLLRSYAASWDI